MHGVTYCGAANLNVVPRRGGGRSVVSEQSGGRSNRSCDLFISSYIDEKIVSAVSSTDVPLAREVKGAPHVLFSLTCPWVLHVTSYRNTYKTANMFQRFSIDPDDARCS